MKLNNKGGINNMSTTDDKYKKLVNTILKKGELEQPEHVRAKYESDGTPAISKKIINYQLKFDTQKEVPILTTKRVPTKDPIIELDWIWKHMSNDVNFLNELGCKVWNQWKQSDNTIGSAYGYQLRNKKQKVKMDNLLVDMFYNGEFSFKPTDKDIEWGKEHYLELFKHNEYIIELNQVDYLLYSLKANPHSRRIITTLWNVEDLERMALQPCVYETQWSVFKGKLNLTVGVRSNDVALGLPYNIYQYFVLLKRISQVSGFESGELCFNITIPHIYDRHIETIKEQISYEPYEQPEFYINHEIKSFYDFTTEDTKLINYQHHVNVKYELAI